MAIRTDGYAPLGAYAVLGDMRGAALVATDGAIDWLALPVMDAPPVCAALLDPAAGGSVELTPTVPFRVARRYLGATMVLETTFITDGGTVRVTDCLNRGAAGELPWSELARRIEADEGDVPMRWSVRPGHGLAAIRPWCHLRNGQVRILVGDRLLAVVSDGLGEPALDSGGVGGEFVAQRDRPGLLAVVASEGEPLHVPSGGEIDARIDATAAAWRGWSEQITYRGPWAETVVRSALTLKALTVAPGGAIAAAATTSLPEQVGGKRNFDYRFAWIRDASFAIDAMNRLGLGEEVHASLTWLLDAVAQEAPDLRVFYALDGSVVSAEMHAADAPGYRESKPVNIGNSAADQTQLGCFGDLLDAILRYVQGGGTLDAATSDLVGALADRVCELWRSPDAGLWELGDAEPYTISKIACWVALDRALRLADANQITNLHADRWRSEREQIRSWIEANCWSENKHAYTFYAGTDDLDAAVLLAARTGYCEGTDPRLHATIDAIATELGAGEALLYRYSGQADKEGAFLACSCWMVEALAHAGLREEATKWFEQIVHHANDVGLYTEEIDPGSRDLLGNLPQTLSHLAVIGAATAIEQATG
ncbi:MAG: glycoside hydrolase family 15 protein [Solirubrobacteraceae bacterium]